MQAIDLGTLLQDTILFKDANGDAADPSDVRFLVRGQQDVEATEYVYGTDTDVISRTTTGLFVGKVVPTYAGIWNFWWLGVGVPTVATGGTVYVNQASTTAPVSGVVRPTMTDLIDRVRLLVNDPASADQIFTDYDYQSWLDLHRTEVRLVELDPDPIISTGGHLSWQDFYAPKGLGPFEQDAVFQGPSWDTITPDSSEYLVGHFHWNASHVYPIWITGKSFDLHGAAADALEAWASALALEFSMSSDGQRFDRQQQRTSLLEQAREQRKKQKPRSASFGRRDIYCS